MMRLIAFVAASLLLFAAHSSVMATSMQTSPLGVPIQKTEGAPQGAPQAQPGVMTRAWYWILAEQQRINRELAAAVREMKTGNVVHGTLLLAFLSFMYGVLHAAGPGHGKAIISSYVLANERTVRRGIMLSFLAAVIQALSAIAVVGVLAILLNATSLEIRATEAWIETVSWAFVALVGLWLLAGQVGKILDHRRAKLREAFTHQTGTQGGVLHSAKHGADHADHVHAADGSCCADHAPLAVSAKAVGDVPVRRVEAHHVHSEDGSCCGHAHVPDARDLEGDLSWTKALAIAFSVGIRPCTGAILVLIFALSQGMFLAGVFSAFAMALGTAITVSVLASMALGSRELAQRFAGGDSGWTQVIASSAGLIGSALVFFMGASFFVASLNGPGPL